MHDVDFILFGVATTLKAPVYQHINLTWLFKQDTLMMEND